MKHDCSNTQMMNVLLQNLPQEYPRKLYWRALQYRQPNGEEI